MDKWIIGIEPNQRVDYVVNYEVSGFRKDSAVQCSIRLHKRNVILMYPLLVF